MNDVRFCSFRLVASSVLCCALVACAGGVDPAAPVVVRTAPPQGYEKTITDYLAFRVRPRKNVEVRIDQPEPGPCALDGYAASMRGWVVPVVSATRSGELTGKQAIQITTKQYYFWFRGDTIAGITRRIELCPGVGTVFSEDAQPVAFEAASPATAATAAIAAPPKPDSSARNLAPGHEGQKASSSSRKAHRAVKKIHPASRKTKTKTKPKLEW